MREAGRRCRGLIQFIILLSLLLLRPVAAQEPAKPVLHIAQAAHDFGTVTEGQKVQHEFTVLNRGTSDLAIHKVISGCGCTAATAINQAIAPNAETKINVTLDTTGLGGPQNKTIRIYSNDPDKPISTVSLTGQVKVNFSAEPANIIFDNVVRSSDKEYSMPVVVKATPGSGVRIGEIETFSKNIAVEDIKGNDQEKTFRVKLVGTLPLGDFRERVLVTLEGASRKTVNIPVYANVGGNLIIKPLAVSFGVISGDEMLVREVELDNTSETPYFLKQVESADPAVTAEVKELNPGKKYLVKVSLDPAKLKGDLRSELKFEAETELEEELAINVYGVQPPRI